MFNLKKDIISVLFLFFCTAGTVNAQRVKSGALTILSDPTEAKVWIDGNYVGFTPLKNTILPVGNHSVRVLDEINQISQTKSVEIFQDSTVIIDIALEREFGGINVITKPEGAEVVFTSTLGKTPLTDDKIIPGAYTVKIGMPNTRYGAIQKEVIVSPNSTIEINEILTKKKKMTPLQLGLRIGLGVASIGCYYWGFSEMNDNDVKPATVGFALGTTCVVGLTTVSIVF